MTCSQCKYDFCWLCLGDYQKHRTETGNELCSTYEDVVKAGRAEGQIIENVENIQAELKKFE